MPSDIFAFIQSQPQAQAAIQTLIPSAQTDATQTQPGLFDSLVTQYVLQNEEVSEALTEIIALPDIPEQELTFTASNSFSQTIIDILAGTNDTETSEPEISIQAEDEEIIWFENTSEPDNLPESNILPDVPVDEPEAENIQPETASPVRDIISKVKNFLSDNPEANIDEVISFILNDEDIAEFLPKEINNSETEIKTLDDLLDVLKDIPDSKADLQDLKAVISSHLAPSKTEAPAITDTDDDQDDSEDTEEPAISDTDTIKAGTAIAPAYAPEAPITPEVQEPDTARKAPVNIMDTSSQPAQPRQIRTEQREAPDIQPEQQTTETQETPQTFRETFQARTAQDNPGQDNQPEQDTTQDNDNGNNQTGENTRENTTRTRTDNHRTDRNRAADRT